MNLVSEATLPPKPARNVTIFSTFDKTNIDPSYQQITNLSKYQFTRRLTELKLKVIQDLAQHNDAGQHAACLVFMIRDLREQCHKLKQAASSLRQEVDLHREQSDLQRWTAQVSSLEQICLGQISPQPRFLNHSGSRVLASGNSILDILMANSAYKLKYQSDQLLPNQLIPLESLKARLVVALLLLGLTDPQNVGFSLEPGVQIEQQKVVTDLTKQSFVWVHQKLVSVLEPYELIANTNIDEWLELSTSASPGKQQSPSKGESKMPAIQEVEELDDEPALNSYSHSASIQRPQASLSPISPQPYSQAVPSAAFPWQQPQPMTQTPSQPSTEKIVITSTLRGNSQGPRHHV